MTEVVSGFDWDAGNRQKCQKHGVSIADIEGLFGGRVMVRPDVAHSRAETRFLAIGQSQVGRYLFVAFTMREVDGQRTVRPMSARPMHQKEVEDYEKAYPGNEER